MSPAPGWGHKSYLAFGKETTWAVAVAATQKLALVSESIQLKRVGIDDPSQTGQLSRRSPYEGPRWVLGSFTVCANFDGLLELKEGGLRVTLIKAVVKAAGRAKQLVESQNS